MDISFGGAIIAGLLSFMSPCVLPMVPFYLCYMAGISINNLQGQDDIPLHIHRRLIISSVFFALGITSVFVLLGMGSTILGQVFREWQRELSYIAAFILAVFGLHFLGIFKISFLYKEAKITSRINPSTWSGSYIMGLTFGFGWTPCVGPALAAILAIAGGMGDTIKGGLLLLVYGLSMTFPFVIAAIFAKPFLHWLQRNRKYLGYVEKIMGIMLLVFALLIATNSVNYIANFIIKYIPWLTTIG